MRKHLLLGLICGLPLLIHSQWLCAELKVVDGSALVKKAQGLIRQLNQDKATLAAEKADLLAANSALQAQVQTLQAQLKPLQALPGQLQSYQTLLTTVKTNYDLQLAQQHEREQLIVQKHNEVLAKARQINADNQLLVQAVQEREHWIEHCSKNNQHLYETNQELIGHYQNKGFWQQLAELEPITGIAKVATENTAEHYRYQLKQLKVTPFTAQINTGSNSSADATPTSAEAEAK